MGTLQFSIGCPYRCEFCDIPGLYGRQPRLKTPQQITAELDSICAQNGPADDALFRRRQFHRQSQGRAGDAAASGRLAEAQLGYPMMFACEATLNIAKQTEILELMREAQLHRHLRRHRDAGGRRAQGHARRSRTTPCRCWSRSGRSTATGWRSRPGIILGLDTDTADTESRLKDFIDLLANPDADHQSAAGAAEDAAVGPPQARWPARSRTDAREQRAFLRPYDEVVACGAASIAYANDPERLFARFRYQVDATYVNRVVTPAKRQAHLVKPARRCRAGVARAAPSRLPVGLSAGRSGAPPSTRCVAARSTACSGWLHGLSLDRIHARGAAGEQNASFYSQPARSAREPMASRAKAHRGLALNEQVAA